MVSTPRKPPLSSHPHPQLLTISLYPVAEPFGRGVLWVAVLFAGTLWLNRKRELTRTFDPWSGLRTFPLMRIRLAHLLWLTVCCGLAFLLISLRLYEIRVQTISADGLVDGYLMSYAIADLFGRGVLSSAVLFAGVLWLNRQPQRSESNATSTTMTTPIMTTSPSPRT